MDLKAGRHRCEEASTLSGASYIPCNAPARWKVAWPARGEGPLRMCDSCMHHNVKNRGVTCIGAYVPDAEEEIPE